MAPSSTNASARVTPSTAAVRTASSERVQTEVQEAARSPARRADANRRSIGWRAGLDSNQRPWLRRRLDVRATMGAFGEIAEHSSLLDLSQDLSGDSDTFEPSRNHRGSWRAAGGFTCVASGVGDEAHDFGERGSIAELQLGSFVTKDDWEIAVSPWIPLPSGSRDSATREGFRRNRREGNGPKKVK
jgi:hypothetical protein